MIDTLENQQDQNSVSEAKETLSQEATSHETTPQEAIIQVVDLKKDYYLNDKRIEVLSGVNLEFRQGERISIVGKSGVGKSTLMHVLGTLDAPSSGNVYFEGKDVFKRSDKELSIYRNKTIGFVFQFHYLLPAFSALENVLIPMKIAKQDPDTANIRAKEVLEQVELGHRLNHKPGELSGGEQQRVAIARALVMNPKVLMLDEPTGNLDAQTSEAIHDLINNLNEVYNTTLIVVTHNQSLADRMDRRLVLLDGNVVDNNNLSG